MKKVLIVAYHFPPISTIGAMRPLAFCRHLPAFGWAPRVLAADPRSVTPPLPLDQELAARIPAGTRVDRIAHSNPVATMSRLRDGLRRRMQVQSEVNVARAPGAPSSPLSVLKELTLQHLFQIPDAQRWWQGPAVRAGLCGERPDVVYATGGPWTALLVGRSLAQHFQVPFIADFRDPWTRNPFRQYRSSVWQRNRRLEGEVCRAAARVVTNTPQLRQGFADDYPDIREKFVTISNGFDTTDQGAHEGLPEQERRGEVPPPLLELWHFGTIYGKRSPTALLTAIAELVEKGVLHAGSLRIRFVGRWEVDEDDPSSRQARLLGELGIVTRESEVPHRTCLALMSRAQALLVIQPGSPLQIPGTLYEYIATRRPLVLIGGEGATADLVTRQGLGRCCSNDIESIQRLLVELRNGDGLTLPSAEAVERFEYRQLTGQLADLFSTSLNGHSLRLRAAVA